MEQISKDLPISKQQEQDLASAFGTLGTRNEMTEILKELFDQNKLHMIGDMTRDEIKIATRIFALAKLKDLDLWTETVNYYMTLLISTNRKSRKEILEAVKGYGMQKNLMQRMANPFGLFGRR